MKKCFFCKIEGEIGDNLCKHNDKEKGEIIVCYNCHAKRHHDLNTKK